jgi:hypothetical protein
MLEVEDRYRKPIFVKLGYIVSAKPDPEHKELDLEDINSNDLHAVEGEYMYHELIEMIMGKKHAERFWLDEILLDEGGIGEIGDKWDKLWECVHFNKGLGDGINNLLSYLDWCKHSFKHLAPKAALEEAITTTCIAPDDLDQVLEMIEFLTGATFSGIEMMNTPPQWLLEKYPAYQTSMEQDLK